MQPDPREASSPPAYPAMPWHSPPADDPPQPAGKGPRLAAVALLSALLGAVLGSGLAVLAIDARAPEPVVVEEPSEPDTSAPVIEVTGDEELDRVAAVAAAVLPSVVRIDIEGGVGGGVGNGSGVIYRSDGHIITNNHVVADADSINVVLADGSRLEAEVVGTDPENDLAVVRVDRNGLPAAQVGA
jgi:S1-C subfamily serine protease